LPGAVLLFEVVGGGLMGGSAHAGGAARRAVGSPSAAAGAAPEVLDMIFCHVDQSINRIGARPRGYGNCA